MERPPGARRASQLVEQIEQSGIDRVLLAGSVVPKESEELRQGRGNVRTVGEIGSRQSLAGMGVEEGKDAFLPIWPVRERARGRRKR